VNLNFLPLHGPYVSHFVILRLSSTWELDIMSSGGDVSSRL